MVLSIRKSKKKDLKEKRIIEKMYKENRKNINTLVRSFHNVILNPEDIFHDGLIILLMSIRENKIKDINKINFFFYGVCKNICLKQLRQTKEILKENNFEMIMEEQLDKEELYCKLLEYKNQLNPEEQRIIDIRFGLNNLPENKKTNNIKYKEIAKKLGITVENARVKYKRAKEKLIKIIKTDPDNEILIIN
ncbi:MAG: sigma-70 family RNA polymerase sigma factor [Bacteroidetes bacterium]|jgi:RNA polymerase sigma factor (sigma-70 family)|nr:sigma-70 family RNA polymerase sigma factor [Bacteroidota bacterium]